MAREFADLKPEDVLYDLYTGTGTIANFCAAHCRRVVGIEYVPEAIADAKINSEINGIGNTAFYAGDMKQVLCRERGKAGEEVTRKPLPGSFSSGRRNRNGNKSRRAAFLSMPRREPRPEKQTGAMQYPAVLAFYL